MLIEILREAERKLKYGKKPVRDKTTPKHFKCCVCRKKISFKEARRNNAIVQTVNELCAVAGLEPLFWEFLRDNVGNKYFDGDGIAKDAEEYDWRFPGDEWITPTICDYCANIRFLQTFIWGFHLGVCLHNRAVEWLGSKR